MKIKIFVLFFLLGCTDDMQLTQQGIICSRLVTRNPIPDSDNVIVLLDIGQSNSIGRAESDRLALTVHPEQPAKVYVYYKTDYTSSDNGSWLPLHHGQNTEEPDQPVGGRTFGSSGLVAAKLRDYLNRDIYVIQCGDGATALEAAMGLRDWDPTSTNECFDVTFDNYFAVAIGKLETANPGKTIFIAGIMWHQGETDATNDTAKLNYASNFNALLAAIDAYDSRLADAPVIMTKLNYLQTAGETDINNTLASLQTSRIRLTDISDMPRKVDLTAGQIGGFTATTADDEHTSYLGQIAKAERVFNHIVDYFGWVSVPISEITSNTDFDPSTLSASGMRLSCVRSSLTIGGSDNIVSAITDDLNSYDFTVTTGSPRFKVDKRRGNVSYPSALNTYASSSGAIGNNFFQTSWSFSCWVKVRDGQPSANYALLHDVASTGAPANSRVGVLITTAGKINSFISISGTTVNATTANVIFANNTPPDWTHIAVTATSGGLIRIYVNGVLQTLDAGAAGDISGLTLANYNNATNAMIIGALRSGSIINHFTGFIREITLQPVVYSAGDIANLMLN